MRTERRGPQVLNRNQLTPSGHRATQKGSKTTFDFKLELQSNSWLRIGLSAKDTKKKFNNLFCHFTVANLREAFHALDGSKAEGIDGISKRAYGENLDQRLCELTQALHEGTYRPQAKRGREIPKANGKTRPIAISSFEDKLVEWVLAKILSSVYEPMFIRTSFGFRPGRSAHDALKASYCSLKDNARPFVVEIDLASFFDTVSHRKLMRLIKRRITDKRVHALIARLLKAGVLKESGELQVGDLGTPQGSVMSPVLANVFLHYALDEWFLTTQAKAKGVIVRYADDAIFIFETEFEAELFRTALKSRLGAFGLRLNEEKSGLIKFEKRHENVFNFLGMTFYWGKERGMSRKRTLKVKTERAKLFRKIQDYKEWISENRNRYKLDRLWDLTAAKLRGHYNYYGVQTNRAKLSHFYHATVGLLFRWLNRRSQKRSFTWESFAARLRHKPLPQPPPVRVLKPLMDRRVYAY